MCQSSRMTIALANLELTPLKWPTIKKMAKKGAPSAMYLMGIAYMLGGLVDIDSKKAYFWLGKAASKGHADAAFRSGFLLHHDHVKDDENTPTQWYIKAAGLGSPAAMCALGNEWTYNKITQQRWWHRWIGGTDNSDAARAAVARYETAQAENYNYANYFLGIHYLRGWGVVKNKNRAIEYFEEGISEKDKDCALALALAQPYNSTEYWHRLEQAADWGNAQAQFKLAVAFLTKRTASADGQAIMWLRKASIQRYPKAMLLLSQTLALGKNTAVDIPNAYRWARRCRAVQGCSSVWVDKLFTQLTNEEQQLAANENDIDDKEFHAMSQKLFGTAGF